jgi:hypothetical protein
MAERVLAAYQGLSTGTKAAAMSPKLRDDERR